MVATSGVRAEEAWSAFACKLKNVLAPARLQEPGEPAEQSGLCLHSVWASQTRPACLSSDCEGQLLLHAPPSTTLTTPGVSVHGWSSGSAGSKCQMSWRKDSFVFGGATLPRMPKGQMSLDSKACQFPAVWLLDCHSTSLSYILNCQKEIFTENSTRLL